MDTPCFYASEGIIKIMEEVRNNTGDFYFFEYVAGGPEMPTFSLPSNFHYEEEKDEIIEEVYEDDEGYRTTVIIEKEKEEVIPSKIDIPVIYNPEKWDKEDLKMYNHLLEAENFYLFVCYLI